MQQVEKLPVHWATISFQTLRLVSFYYSFVYWTFKHQLIVLII